MKSGAVRYWFVLFAALIATSVVATATRAGTVERAGNESTASRVCDAGGEQHPCLDSDGAAHCIAHCAQTRSVSNDAQSIAGDASRLVPVLPAGVTRLRFRTQTRLLAIAPAAPAAGPPLTILFHNLRI
jgi:hypothetical protein